MHRRVIDIVLLGLGWLAAAPCIGHAQQRRTGGPETRRAASALPRLPYAGTWEGSVTEMRNGPGTGMPLRMVIEVADSATPRYTGATLLPNDARAPHLDVTVDGGAMRWAQRNIDGGRWAYVGRLAGPDSLVGTLTLRSPNWPTAPTGTFVLLRRRAGTRRGS